MGTRAHEEATTSVAVKTVIAFTRDAPCPH